MMKWTVLKEESGLKLVKFLQLKIKKASLKQLKRYLEDNVCEVNGKKERFATAVLYEGDVVTFKMPQNESAPKVTGQFVKADILYEDADLFVYNKPAGINSDAFKTEYLLIHRLDQDTTGVLMFAKKQQVLEKMVALFRERLVKKHYLAVVEGIVKKNQGVIDNYLGKKHQLHGQAIWGAVSKEKGLHAITEWKVEKRGKDFSVLSCFPKTGRTHQIRVHLSEMHHPILGDYQYCREFETDYEVKRQLLHAYKVVFFHPVTKKPLQIKAPIPSDFVKFL